MATSTATLSTTKPTKLVGIIEGGVQHTQDLFHLWGVDRRNTFIIYIATRLIDGNVGMAVETEKLARF